MSIAKTLKLILLVSEISLKPSAIVSKGQKKAKWFFQVEVSSKKRMNKFYFTTMKPQADLFFFIFWRKLKTPKRHFEIIWPFALRAYCLNIYIPCFRTQMTTTRRRCALASSHWCKKVEGPWETKAWIHSPLDSPFTIWLIQIRHPSLWIRTICVTTEPLPVPRSLLTYVR